MSAAAVSLTTTFAIVAIGASIGFLAGVHRKMDLQQWTVGGRGFGVALMFLLMAANPFWGNWPHVRCLGPLSAGAPDYARCDL